MCKIQAAWGLICILLFMENNINGFNANGKFYILAEYGYRLLDTRIMEMCVLWVVNVIAVKRKLFNSRCSSNVKHY